ncbi:hypothetical protein JCM8547_000951 [Rhodosporidiobolus lusitaniae]
MSFVLPNVSTSEQARREQHNAFACPSSAAQNGAGLATATSEQRGHVGGAQGGGGGGNKARRKGKGKGRMMMIKIFYALNSPRFGSSSSAPTPSSSAPTPDFLAVLDPALAPSPQPTTPTPSPSSSEPNYSCIARLSAPVWVQVVNAKGAGEGGQQFGRVTLKTCLSAICISRPELVIDSTKDFSVSAVDPYESSHQRQPPAGSGNAPSSTSSQPGDGLVEGKGMLSWTLAEKKEGTTIVCGKITGGESSDSRKDKRRKGEDGGVVMNDGEDDDSESGDEELETLEIWLQLTEREAFTQGQFLDCLRSYHNPVQQLQSEISDFNSSPPKPREHNSSSSSFLRSSGPVGDPIKRKRPRDSNPSLSIPPVPAAVPPPPFAAASASSPAYPPAPAPAAPTANPALQDPHILALLGQLVPSLAAANAAAGAPAPSLSLDSPQGQALLPAIRTLAQFYGLELPLPPSAQQPIPAASVPLPSSMPPSSTAAGPSSHLQQSARPPTGVPALSSTGAAGAKQGRRKEREHFATIDPNTLAVPPQGKQNPRDAAGGCSNCKRRKSTVWREGTGLNGKTTSVCNACGIFYNKNGYHRSKGNADANKPTASTSNAAPPSSTASAILPKQGRPLKGRLTATCEADLQKQRTKPRKSGSPTDRHHHAGIIPPLSPSKQIGPRSPSLNFSLSHGTRTAGRALGGAMSSPGRSPRLKYRQTSNPFSATSPVRGSSSSNNPGLGVSYDSDGEDRNLSFGNLFGGGAPGSPSPVRIVDNRQPGGSGGKNIPSYLLTASPGTALDRILNDTNISLSGMLGSGGQQGRDGMHLEPQRGPVEGGFADFNFFLTPNSPTLNKENRRPSKRDDEAAANPTSTSAAPTTDFDAFDPVLSSLRRDFSTRLSSNALTAPSSPAPLSPCILPRTSTATPGSKGKAPASSGRAPPSMFDGFVDGLVPAFALSGDVGAGNPSGTTPESEGWSPSHGGGRGGNEDHTLMFNSNGMLKSSANGADHLDLSLPADVGNIFAASTGSGSGLNDFKPSSNHNLPTRRAAFIPAHLLPPQSDAATEFDFGSLPPSSPPQLQSEAFATPSEFDGITPSADGGDVDERERPGTSAGLPGAAGGMGGGSPLTIEAVAEKVASKPNEEARRAMMQLLQSLGSGESAGGAQGGGGGGGIDRSTVNRLLSLISANTADATASSTPPQSANSPAPFATGSHSHQHSHSYGNGMTASASTATITAKSTRSHAPSQQDDHETDITAFDLFRSLQRQPDDGRLDDGQNVHSGQVDDLFGDLFGGGGGF